MNEGITTLLCSILTLDKGKLYNILTQRQTIKMQCNEVALRMWCANDFIIAAITCRTSRVNISEQLECQRQLLHDYTSLLKPWIRQHVRCHVSNGLRAIILNIGIVGVEGALTKQYYGIRGTPFLGESNLTGNYCGQGKL